MQNLNVIEELNFGDVSFGGLSVVYPHNNELFLGHINLTG